MVHQECRERKSGGWRLDRRPWQRASLESDLLTVARSGIRRRPP
jgi:hypothetical protein